MGSTESTSSSQSQEGRQLPLCGGQRLRGIFAENTADYPLVTVVTAIYNGRRFLVECLESVLKQDYPNVEHLLFDAGSTDGTVEVLRQHEDRIALWRSEPDRGVYDAWNKALVDARGEWICFLGVDDEFLPGAISAYVSLARKNPDAEYLSSRVKLVHPSGYERINGWPWEWNRFSRWMCVSHVGSMHRRSLYERLGAYDLSFGGAADYELLLRAREGLKAAYMPVTTAIMRTGGMTDGPNAFADATRAKILTGGRNRFLAIVELRIANIRYFLRPLRRAVGRFLSRYGLRNFRPRMARQGG